MKVTTERLDNCQVNVIVELDAAEVDKKLRETARKISRKFTVPGYRRGKAPFHAVARVFGREAIQQQALEDFGNEWYDQALEEIEYKPYDVGSLQEVEWDPFRMNILLPIPPEVDLGDYRSVRVPFEPEEVSDESVDEQVENLRQELAQWVPVERPAELGDQVVLDMLGVAGGEPVMDNENYELILDAEADYPLPGFHEQIVGLSAGEEKTFTLTVPEDDEAEEVAGKEATITVTLHSVKAKDLPAWDDELALMVGDYETLDDLKAATRERLEGEASQRAEVEYLDQVLEAMIAAARIEYPPQAVDREVDFTLGRMEQNLASSGLQLERYLAMLGKTREEYKQELRPAAEEQLKKRLVLNKVAEAERLTVGEEEVEAEIDRLVEMMGDRTGEMREALRSPGGQMSVMDDLLVNKTQRRIIQISKGEAPPLEEAEVEAVVEKASAEEGDEASAPETTPDEGETQVEVEETASESEVEASAPETVPDEEETQVEVEETASESEVEASVPETVPDEGEAQAGGEAE